MLFSADWSREGASVVFDRNSGDYWVLDGKALQVVKRIASPEADPAGHHDSTFIENDLSLLQTLCDAGILERI